LKIDERKVCGECQTRMSHQKLRLNITYKGLKLLHMKLMEPMQVESLYGKKFAMVDDFSRYIWTKNKSDVVEIFKDCCLKPQGEKLMVAQIDMDNIGFGRRSDQMVEHVARQMQSEVGKSFVGLGLQVKQIEESIFLSQSKCAKNNVKKIGMKSARTPAPTHSKVFKDENGVCAIYQAEYITTGSSCSQQGWLKLMLTKYNVTHDVMTLYYDNLSSTTMSKNLIQHSWTKHINVCHHSIRKFVALKHEMQLADKFARVLDDNQFECLRGKLGICNHEKL